MRLFHRSPTTIGISLIGAFIVLLLLSLLIGSSLWTNLFGSASVPLSSAVSVHIIAISVVLSSMGILLGFFRGYSRSISKITEAAEQIGTGEQHRRIEVEGPPEIRKLTEAFNGMAARLEENLAQQTKLQHSLKELAITDDLTGLYNRRELNRLLAQEFRRAKRFQRPLSMIVFDIDRFKQVNDRYGHLVGDQVLAWASNLIATNTRMTNFVARYGGDEFVILLPETNSQNAFHAAERLRTMISQSSFSGRDKDGAPISISITISLGIAELDGETSSVKDFFSLADQALYKSKHSGRNKTQIAAVQIKNSDQ